MLKHCTKSSTDFSLSKLNSARSNWPGYHVIFTFFEKWPRPTGRVKKVGVTPPRTPPAVPKYGRHGGLGPGGPRITQITVLRTTATVPGQPRIFRLYHYPVRGSIPPKTTFYPRINLHLVSKPPFSFSIKPPFDTRLTLV